MTSLPKIAQEIANLITDQSDISLIKITNVGSDRHIHYSSNTWRKKDNTEFELMARFELVFSDDEVRIRKLYGMVTQFSAGFKYANPDFPENILHWIEQKALMPRDYS